MGHTSRSLCHLGGHFEFVQALFGCQSLLGVPLRYHARFQLTEDVVLRCNESEE